MSSIAPPQTEEELLERARRLAGRTLGEVAALLGEEVPADFRRAKGWVGRLLEDALGATAASRPTPDFEALGIELKTLPVDERGRPRESTYLCTVELVDVDEITWETSLARKKLARVLWIPVLASREVPIPQRMVGAPLLWSPTEAQEAALRRDWEEHMHVIRQGFVDHITAHDGTYLQIRPKAADSRALTWSVDARGEAIMTLPRGYYLRTCFTAALLQEYFALQR